MAIYSSNRLNNMNEDNYRTTNMVDIDFGSMDLVMECHQMMQDTFDLALKSDVMSIVATNENTDEANAKSTIVLENTLSTINTKINELLDKLAEKVKEITEKFYAKMRDLFNKSVNALLKKAKASFLKKDLSDMKVKNFEMFTIGAYDKYINGAEKLLSDIASSADLSITVGEPFSTLFSKTDNGLKYNGENASKFKKNMHDEIFSKGSEYPFKDDPSLKKTVVDVLSSIGGNNSTIYRTKKLRKDIVNSVKKLKAKITKANILKNPELIKTARVSASNIVSAVNTVMNACINEERKMISTCFRLFKMGVAFNPTAKDEAALEEENDYMEAIGEAADYEIEAIMCSDLPSITESTDDTDALFDMLFNDTEYSFM